MIGEASPSIRVKQPSALLEELRQYRYVCITATMLQFALSGMMMAKLNSSAYKIVSIEGRKAYSTCISIYCMFYENIGVLIDTLTKA